jgi:hypothetical protein
MRARIMTNEGKLNTEKTFMLRPVGGNVNRRSWSLVVPIDLVRTVGEEELRRVEFAVEIVPEGILYRAVGHVTSGPPEDWPGNERPA